MFSNIEEIKSAIARGDYGNRNSRYGKISIKLIHPKIFENLRDIEILFDLEHHFSFDVLMSLSDSVWCDKNKFSNIFGYFKSYRIFNPEINYPELFDFLSKKLCEEIKNDGHFLLTKTVGLRDPVLIESFIQKINPKTLNNEEYKERYLKMLNKALIFDMAEKVNGVK